MNTPKFLRAALLAPVFAALTTVVLWGIAPAVDADWTRDGSESAIATAVRIIWVAGFVFLVALLVATAAEVLVGVPLFYVFRRLGWLSHTAFLVGGIVASVAACLAIQHNSSHIPLNVFVGYAVPGLVGSLAFGYIGGWLPNTSPKWPPPV